MFVLDQIDAEDALFFKLRGYWSCFALSIFAKLTKALEPIREQLSSIKAFAASIVRIPPAAFIFTPSPICLANSATSSGVAPPEEKPVDVLI